MTTQSAPRRWLWRSRHASFAVDLRLVAVTLALAGLTLLASLYAITLGRISIPFAEVLATLAGHGDGGMRQQIGAPWESLQYYPLRDFWRDGKQMISA